MSESPEVFSQLFWEELSELDDLGRRAYAEYLAARDALFACYGRNDAPDLLDLWRRYCESARLLNRIALEARAFTGKNGEDN